MNNHYLSKLQYYILGGAIIAIFYIANIPSLHSQSRSIFKSVDQSIEKDLKKVEKDFIKTMRETTKSVSFISVEKIEDNLIEGKINIAVDAKDTITAKVLHWEYLSGSDWQFYGEIEGMIGGSVQLTAGKRGMSGLIYYGSRFFEIFTTDHFDVSILLEHHPQKGICGNTNKEKTEKLETELSPRSINSCDLSKVRVLVLYTNNALNAVNQNLSTITDRINNGISIFNNANIISNVNVAQANLELAEILPTDYIEYKLNFPSPNSSESNTYFDFVRNATKTAKIIYKADVLILLTAYPNWTDTYGIAKRVKAENDDDAYAMVQIGYADAAYVFAHEVGHLLGGGHINSDGLNNSAHTYNFRTCGGSCPPQFQKYTIMTSATAQGNNIRAFRWSNPNVYDGIEATGTSSSNVAYRLGQTAQTVAGFRESPNSENALMSGPLNVYNMGTYSYSMAAGCPNPSAYNWYTSSNGYTWSWAGNGGGISQFFYPNFPSPFYVKCVLSYPGLPDKNYFRTTNIIYNPPYKIAKQDQINGLTPMLSPNPVNEYVIIDIALNKDQIKSVKCFNEFGLEINLKYEY